MTAYGIAQPTLRPVVSLLPLLDRISVAATGAYALFRLRRAFAGACIRVRRSSDNTEQDVGLAGDSLDTASLLAFVGGGDGYISKWYDQSGNARDFAQATAAAQPKIVSGGALIATINSLPSMSFDGATQYLSRSTGNAWSFLSSGGYTIIGLVRPTVATGTTNGAGNGGSYIFGGDGLQILYSFGVSALVTGFYQAATYKSAVRSGLGYPNNYIPIARYDGTTLSAYVDGGTPATGTGGPPDTGGANATIGRGTTVAGYYFAGQMAAVLMFNSALSAANINGLGRELGRLGGKTWGDVP
jgi:hypothetical protein